MSYACPFLRGRVFYTDGVKMRQVSDEIVSVSIDTKLVFSKASKNFSFAIFLQ